MMPTVVFIAFITGLLLGSFFNVLIWRLPRNESIVWPPSHCTHCGRNIRPWENIPFFSYILLRGRCAGCKNKISIQYPIIELITGFSAAILSFQIVNTMSTPVSWAVIIPALTQFIFLLLMIPMTVIDFKHYIIPDQFTLPFIAVGLGLSFLPDMTTPLNSLAGIIAGGGFLYLTGLIGSIVLKKGDAMGGGDIKLMAAVGALWGSQIALMGIVFGALLGSLVGILLITLKKLSSDHRIAFGPFLGMGIWISVLSGNQILSYYQMLIERIFN